MFELGEQIVNAKLPCTTKQTDKRKTEKTYGVQYVPMAKPDTFRSGVPRYISCK